MATSSSYLYLNRWMAIIYDIFNITNPIHPLTFSIFHAVINHHRIVEHHPKSRDANIVTTMTKTRWDRGIDSYWLSQQHKLKSVLS